MTDFTPGPYISRDGANYGRGATPHTVDVISEGGLIVAECAGVDRVANARLLAAAPTLLKVLQAIQAATTFDNGRPTINLDGETQWAVNQAIALATGGKP